MIAAVYRGAKALQIEEVEIPEIGDRDVLVKVSVCGVCGTDLKKISLGLQPPPRIYGHETTGTICKVGSEVAKWREGDRVAVNHHIPCMQLDCFYCSRRAFAQCPIYKKTGATAGFEPAGGGFAEYVRVMDWCVDGMIKIPEGVSFEEASFVEPLNTCLKGVHIAGIQSGDTVLVIGQGPIGMLFTQLAVLQGAKVVATDKIAHRREISLSFGAKAALHPDEDVSSAVMGLSEGRGADVGIVAVPHVQVISEAFAQVRPCGKVLLFAQTRLKDFFQVDAGEVCMNEKALIGSYSSDYSLQDEAASLIFSGKVNVGPLITHRFPLSQINEALHLAMNPTEQSLKILTTPSSGCI